MWGCRAGRAGWPLVTVKQGGFLVSYLCYVCLTVVADKRDLTKHLPMHEGPSVSMICEGEFTDRMMMEEHNANQFTVKQVLVSPKCAVRDGVMGYLLRLRSMRFLNEP